MEIYLYAFVYDLPDDGFGEAETCRGDTINDICLFVCLLLIVQFVGLETV